ncbi:hypothetical protein Poli38472_001152 [Pythium oligandrum]|uniref:U2A'/phosphoprotein 32 family A C-terminal domain-containing protein n=1 Tax=Pythium oligandrum TaxID=41045 RepID=A0A8K1CUQ6_PYTOL|nr:hypothetical protein Poli38472_001152 [Pythium oligandrum]|eukprot:TMW68996.1 hypothetical protein Poli38472_001152 [Pythium oligandrum]
MSSSVTAGYKLFTPLTIGKDLVLKNRVVLAPLTRARADPATCIPDEIQQLYYEQRAGAGLLIAEATGISQEGLGWYGAAGLFNDDQMKGWAKHMGRQAHPSFNPNNECVAPSAIPVPEGRIRNKDAEHVPYAVPRALETEEVARIVEDFRKSAVHAKQAGFDCVELHSANGYLIDQFMQSCSNKRSDKYGGSYENRSRFILEIVDVLATVYPSDRVAVRLSPNGAYAGMGSEDNYEMFTYLMRQLSTRDIAYVAILDGFGFGYHDKGRLVTAFDVKTNQMLEHDPVAGKKKGSGATTARALTASPLQSPTDESETNSSPTKQKQPTALSLRANNNKIASLSDMDDALTAVFDHPTRLQWLDLSGNALTSIPPAAFAQYPDIFTLQLHGNQLSKYSDIDNIAKYLTKLHSLTLHGNPIEEKKHYKSYVIASFPQLKQLDFSCVTKGDREKAETWAKIYKQAVQNARERTGRGHQDGASEYD